MRLKLTSVNSLFVSIFFGFLISTELNAAGDIDTTALRDAVELINVRSHQAAFQAAADANGGNRGPGLPGYDDSSDYVVSQLEAAGYAVTVQPFSFQFFEENVPAEFEQLAPNPQAYLYFDVNGFSTMVYSGSGDVTGLVQAVDVMIPAAPDPNTSTSGCEPADFTGFTPGNIALIQRGSCEFQTKAMNAEAAGATAVIIFNEGQPGRTVAFAGTLIDPSVNIPVIGTSYAIGEDFYTTGLGTDVTVRVFVDAISENRYTNNVIAQLGGLQDRVVMAGAHLDSVLTGPGINDNGSGAAALLEIAVQMAALNIKPRNTVRFAWWGGEEAGLLGSHNYLSNLTIEAAKKITAYFDLEMIGSPNFVRFVFDGDGSVFPSAVPEGSAGIEKIINDYYAGLGLDVDAAEFEPHHSYTAFADAGIPVGGIFGGDDGIKTAAQASIFGGTQGDQYDPCYHLACDTFDNVSLAYLDESSDAAAHTILTLAMTSTTQPKGRRTLPSCEEMGYDFSLKADPVYCRKSPSYWTKHPAEWGLDPIAVGGQIYSKTAAIAVMKTKAKGDRSYALFNELVAAKLNVEACGQTSGAIDDAILAADTWLGANPPGSGVRSKDPEWDTGSVLFSELSAFNGGIFQSGSFSFDSLATVEILTDDGIYFDWTSNRSVDAVIVKGGRDANVYPYDPESLGDFDLHAPINRKTDEPYGLSYVEFCFDYDIDIYVHKFHDLDQDGEWDAGEPEIGVDQFVLPDGSIGGSSGWPYLFSFPKDGVTYSDVNRTPGTHQNSEDGIYRIEEFILPLWEQTALYVDGSPVNPLTNWVEFIYGGLSDETHDILFGNIGYARMEGRKYEDLNANGAWDAGEPGVAGVEITLDGTDEHGNPVLLVTLTDTDGFFSFINLIPGTYNVEETGWPAGGWVPSTPTSNGPHVLAVGDNLDLGWVFGNYIPGSIHGHKFHDINGNGVEDDDEPRLTGTLFELVDADGNVLATEVSNGQGEFGFLGLVPGSYRVDEVPPAGWLQTTAGPGWLTIESRQEYVAEDGQAMLPDDSLKYEVLEPSLAFGDFERGSIHGYKFDDINGNGIEDDREPRLPGWDIELIDADGNLLGIDTTDANGEFGFADLGPGTYTVREIIQQGWVQTTPNPPPLTMVSGREYVALDGMANLPGGSTKHEYNVGSDLVFGNAQSGSIHGFKFEDLDGDGVRDPGEPGLEGWTIELDRDGDGVIDFTTTTNVDGEYAFTDLALGTYYLNEVNQEGWVQTTLNPPPVTIESGQEYVSEDGQARLPVGSTRYEINIGADLIFGNAQNGSIHGFKFEDMDGDGVRDPGEPGLEGWTIELDRDGDGVIDFTTTTNVDGEYAFTDLFPGSYDVHEVNQGGWLPTTVTSFTLFIESGQEYVSEDGQARLPDGSTKYEINVGSLVNFGNFQQGSIHGHKFNDLNQNGIDDNEPRLPGVTITLTGDVNGDGVVDVLTTTTAGPSGEYWFTNLIPGDYVITEQAPVGSEQTTTNPPTLTVVSGQEYVALPGQAMLPAGSTKYETLETLLAFGNFEIPNEPPTIISPATADAAENQLSVIDVQATDDNDAEGAGLTFALTGGADLIHFGIFPNSGVIVFNGPPDFENPVDSNGDNYYEVQVTVTDSGPGGNLTAVQNLVITVTNVNETPTAAPQAYNATGNVTINVPSVAGLVNGSSDPDGDSLTVNAVSGVTVGASVAENSDGSFTYTPPPGFTGNDSFNYTLIDDGAGTLVSNVATVTITVSDMIWFIDNSAAVGDGRLSSAFNSMAAFEAVNGNGGANDPEAGDDIFVYTGSGSYSGGVTLENNQQLIGQGTTDTSLADALGITLAPGSDSLPSINGTRPELGPVGTAVTLASGNTVRGLDVSVTGGNQGLVGSTFGTATIDEIAITTETGTALSLNNGNATATIDSITSTTAGGNSAIMLTNTGASAITVNGGTISNKTVDAVTLSSTAGPVTLANMIIEDIGDMAGLVNTRSGHDGVHGQFVSGGLILDGVTIRRISDNCVNGAAFSDGVSATTWDGLDIIDSTIQDCNRFHVASIGDNQDEAAVRIQGLGGTVLIDNNTIARSGSHLDLSTAASGTTTMTITDNAFDNAFKEWGGGLSGEMCINVLVEGTATADVTIGGPGVGNTFLNCAIASINVEKDTVPAGNGNVQVVVDSNTFEVDDHSSSVGTGNFPQGGVALRAGPGGISTFDAVVSNNTFGADNGGSTTNEVMNANGLEGNVGLVFESGVSQVEVSGNTFHGSINAPWFNRADGNTSAAVLYENNTYRGRVDFFSPDAGFGVFQVPGIPYRTRVRNNGNLDISFRNDQFAVHDQSFFAFTETLEFESRVVGGTMCVALDSTSSPDGYEFDELVGTINLYQGLNNAPETGPCTVGDTGDCQAELDNDGVTGGPLGYVSSGTPNPALSPPFVDVDNGSIDITPTACTVPSGGIF